MSRQHPKFPHKGRKNRRRVLVFCVFLFAILAAYGVYALIFESTALGEVKNDVEAPARQHTVSVSEASPFANLSLEEVATSMEHRYAGKKPREWGEHLQGITAQLPENTHIDNLPVIALTFDACDGRKGGGFDPRIIALLNEHNIPATVFVTSLWMRNHKDILEQLANNPLIEVAAHGARHKPCSVNGQSAYGIKGTASFLELIREVEGNVRDIEAVTGKRPKWFRAGTAFYDDIAVAVIHDLQLGIAGYSITADEGATLSAKRVAGKVGKAKNGDILLFHINHPESGTAEGLRQSLPALIEQGYTFVHLQSVGMGGGNDDNERYDEKF